MGQSTRRNQIHSAGRVPVRFLRQSWSSSSPKVLRCLRHNVCKELDLHSANFLQPAGDGQRPCGQGPRRADRSLPQVPDLSASSAYLFVPPSPTTRGALGRARLILLLSPRPAVRKVLAQIHFLASRARYPQAGGFCLPGPVQFPFGEGLVAPWTSPGRQC